jgi:hypothetical protein
MASEEFARMTSADYAELERLCRKAKWHERMNQHNENNAEYLEAIEVYASRRV